MQGDLLEVRGHRFHDCNASVMFIDIVSYIHVEELHNSMTKEILAYSATPLQDT
jgi:hypothetical protein